MTPETLANILKSVNSDTLPGRPAHMRFMPRFKGVGFRSFEPKDNSRISSVLIPIFFESGKAKILFTERSSKLGKHAGQISFPGGGAEPGETPVETALRETREEIGLVVKESDVLCRLSDLYVEPSDSLIRPFAAMAGDIGKATKNDDEVESIFSVDLDYLLNADNVVFRSDLIPGLTADVPCYNVGKSVPLWGATAMILSELLELLGGRANTNCASENGRIF